MNREGRNPHAPASYQHSRAKRWPWSPRPRAHGQQGHTSFIELLAMLMAVAAGFRLFIRGWWSDGKANTDPTTKA